MILPPPWIVIQSANFDILLPAIMQSYGYNYLMSPSSYLFAVAIKIYLSFPAYSVD
jgi:hypothetical protein